MKTWTSSGKAENSTSTMSEVKKLFSSSTSLQTVLENEIMRKIFIQNYLRMMYYVHMTMVYLIPTFIQ